jgi:hypothetical protein
LLRRIFGRLGGQAIPVEPKAALPGAKEGGHGDHWGCVLPSLQEQKLVDYLVEVTRKDDNPENFGPGGSGLVFRSERGPVRTCVLVKDKMLASAYPEVQDGPVWPVTISEVVPWSNGFEGQISGSCYEARVSFFDTRYYSNSDRYRVGDTYDFHVGAFAYTLGRAPDTEFDTGEGLRVSMRGAHAYMPANLDNAQADIDEFWFHSPLEAEKEGAYLTGPPIYGYPIILAMPSDFEMRLTLYAASHALEADMHNVRVEDDLQGYLWLQGYLAG